MEGGRIEGGPLAEPGGPFPGGLIDGGMFAPLGGRFIGGGFTDFIDPS